MKFRLLVRINGKKVDDIQCKSYKHVQETIALLASHDFSVYSAKEIRSVSFAILKFKW